MSVVAEFGRRNVFRVGAAYLVASWLIIQVAETIFPLFGFDETPARIVVIVVAIGFVPALVLAWALRWTPAGLRRESDLDTPPSPEAGRRMDRLIIATLVLAVVVFAIDRFVLDRYRDIAREETVAGRVEEARRQGRAEALTGAYGGRSIVVLPFANLSDDAGNEYFADGISEELLNLLARVPELRVISRSSAFSYKGKDVRLAQIVEELDVSHVLEGSVRRSGNNVRITAQLIDARSDTHLWSETFDRQLDDIFAIQSEIAATVTERMRVSLLGELPRARVTDPDAYALFLRARLVSQQNTAEAYAQAITLLDQALAIDPEYPNAWDALSGVYLNLASKGLVAAAEGFRQGQQAAERALGIDPRFAPAYSRLAWLALLRDNDLKLAAEHYQRALELAPNNVRIIGDVTVLLKTLGRMQECVTLDEYVVARDPVNATGFYNLGGSYLFAGHYEDAITALRTALQLSPNRVGAYFQIGIAELLLGNVDGALASMQSERQELLQLIGKVMAYDATGDRATADDLLAELVAGYELDAAYNIAYVLAFRGDVDGAFVWLQKAVDYGDPGLADVVADPLFDNLHRDPRWLPFLESIGRAPAQLEAIVVDVPIPRS